MKNKTEGRTAFGMGLLVLVLFFTGFVMTGFFYTGIRVQTISGMNTAQSGLDVHAVHTGGNGADTIQTAGIQMLCAAGHSQDNYISEQRSGGSVLSAFRKQNYAIRDAKIYTDSFLAVLFKIAVIPCVIFLLNHFARNVNTYLQRINCGFIHWQDGKKRLALSVSYYNMGMKGSVYHFEHYIAGR